jgi:DNA primase
VLTLPDELDPADYLLQHGKDAFAALLDKAIDALDHKYRTVVAELGANPSTHQVIQAVEGVLAVLAGAPRSVTTVDSAAKLREDQMLVRLAQLSGVAEDRLRKRMNALRRATTQTRASRGEGDGAAEPTAPPTAAFDEEPKFLRDAERFLMEILVAAPQLLVEVRESLACDDLRHPTHRTIYAKVCELNEAGILPDFDRLMLEFDAPEVKNSLVDLDEGRRGKGREATADELRELATVLHDRRSGVSTTTLTGTKSATTTDNSEGDVSALRRSIERQRRRHGISLPTEG